MSTMTVTEVRLIPGVRPAAPAVMPPVMSLWGDDTASETTPVFDALDADVDALLATLDADLAALEFQPWGLAQDDVHALDELADMQAANWIQLVHLSTRTARRSASVPATPAVDEPTATLDVVPADDITGRVTDVEDAYEAAKMADTFESVGITVAPTYWGERLHDRIERTVARLFRRARA